MQEAATAVAAPPCLYGEEEEGEGEGEEEEKL